MKLPSCFSWPSEVRDIRKIWRSDWSLKEQATLRCWVEDNPGFGWMVIITKTSINRNKLFITYCNHNQYQISTTVPFHTSNKQVDTIRRYNTNHQKLIAQLVQEKITSIKLDKQERARKLTKLKQLGRHLTSCGAATIVTSL